MVNWQQRWLCEFSYDERRLSSEPDSHQAGQAHNNQSAERDGGHQGFGFVSSRCWRVCFRQRHESSAVEATLGNSEPIEAPFSFTIGA